jgi:hypothetical protein
MQDNWTYLHWLLHLWRRGRLGPSWLYARPSLHSQAGRNPLCICHISTWVCDLKEIIIHISLAFLCGACFITANAILQMTRSQNLTAEARIQFQSSPFGICCGQYFSAHFCFPLPVISPMLYTELLVFLYNIHNQSSCLLQSLSLVSVSSLTRHLTRSKQGNYFHVLL